MRPADVSVAEVERGYLRYARLRENGKGAGLFPATAVPVAKMLTAIQNSSHLYITIQLHADHVVN